ncbi:5667_t:CDS:2, partial [Entrophospora sp. SA101]
TLLLTSSVASDSERWSLYVPDMQEPVNPWFIPDDEGENGITQIVDTHNQMYLEGPAPDISVVTLNYVLNIYSVDCVGDIKPRKSELYCFQNSHKGQMLKYGLKLLKAQH